MIILKDRKLVVGLDIGTTKVVTLVGEIVKEGNIKIIGIGICKSQGIDKGRINNLDLMVRCIKKSIYKAETMAKCQITSVYLSLSSKHITSQNEIGITPISENEVTKKDIDNVIYTAKSVDTINTNHLLHVIPQEYCIDQQSGIKNPIGLSGMRMQVKVHLITCHHTMTKNIIKALEQCNLKVDKIIFSGLASSKAVLTKDERKLGVCMIDIGGGTIDFTIYVNDCLQDSQVIPYAGNTVTNDIAYVFSTSYHDAENLKIKYGSAKKLSSNTLKNIDFLDIHGNSNYILQPETLIDVIESRYTELFSLINQRILYIQKTLKEEGSQYQLAAGIVITGGASKIAGFTECAEKIFQKKIRIAKPLKIDGLIENLHKPQYSTAIGLLHYGKEFCINIDHKNTNTNISVIEQWLEKINNWITREL